MDSLFFVFQTACAIILTNTMPSLPSIVRAKAHFGRLHEPQPKGWGAGHTPNQGFSPDGTQLNAYFPSPQSIPQHIEVPPNIEAKRIISYFSAVLSY